MLRGITDISALRDWFYNQDTQDQTFTYWTLYQGRIKKVGYVIDKVVDIEDKDLSWDRLERALARQTGGTFTVFLTYKPLHNTGVTTLYTKAADAAAIGGIHGVSGPAIAGGVEKYVELQVQNAMLKRDVEELADQIDEVQAGKGINKLFNRLADSPKLDSLVETLMIKLLGSTSGAKVGNINGVNETPKASMSNEGAVSQELIALTHRLHSLFGDKWLIRLDQIVTWAENNQAMVEQLIKQSEQ